MFGRTIRLTYADWSWREYAAAFAGLAAPQSALKRLSERAQHHFPDAAVFPVNAGRTALKIILSAMREMRPGRDNVVAPAYVCPSVAQAISQCGLTAVWADIGADLNLRTDAAKAAASERTLAVLAIHMYGAPADMAGLAQVAADSGAYLIDDAAQMMGSFDESGPMGSCGAAGLISFAQSKSVVCGLSGSGGLLIVNDPGLLDPIRRRLERLPPDFNALAAFARFVFAYQLETFADLWPHRWRPARAATYEPTAERHISGLHAAIACVQLACYQQRRRRRLQALARFHRAVEGCPLIEFPQYAPDRDLVRIMLTLPQGSEARAVAAAMRSHGIRTRLAYPLPVGADLKNAPAACDIASRLIEFPFAAAWDERILNDSVLRLLSHLESSRRRTSAWSFA